MDLVLRGVVFLALTGAVALGLECLDRVFDLGIARLLSLPVRAGIHTCTGIAASVIALVPLWTTF